MPKNAEGPVRRRTARASTPAKKTRPRASRPAVGVRKVQAAREVVAVATSPHKQKVRTAADAPEPVRRLLKTYDPAALSWAELAARYTVVREILVRGDAEARKWLGRVLTPRQVRALVKAFAGTGCSEPERERLRQELRLGERDIPKRPYLAALWD